MQLNKEQKVKLGKMISNVEAFRKVFSGSGGELALEQIDGLCGYKTNIFDPDPYKHAYNAGQQSVAVLIHIIVELDLRELIKDAEIKTE